MVRATAAVSCLAAVMGAFGVAAADDPLEPNEAHWRLVLAGQLKAEQQCTLNEVLTYQEMPLGNDKGVDGRVSCFDGREFTFSRTGERQKFTIQVCQPTVC